MIKIGDFSKLAHVSIKTLHHYDRFGLLKPSHVDRYTGYRYYALDQLAQLNRILALKDLGLSLDQIAQLLDEDLSTSELRGMLRMKRMELETKVQEEGARLSRVEIRLRQLELDPCPLEHEIAIKQVPAQTVLSARITASSESEIIPTRLSLKELMGERLKRARIKPIGPWFTIVDELAYDERNQEIELAVEIGSKAGSRHGDWGSGPVKIKTLETEPSMASIIHKGDQNVLPTSYTSLFAWMQLNGYKVAGPTREIYLPGSGVSTYPKELDSGFTEVQCPVKPASIPISILSPKDKKEKIMEPKILTKSAFKTVGLSYVGKNENNEIPQMWGDFNQRSHEIPSSDDDCYYGLCFSNPTGRTNLEADEPGAFEYVAACEVENDQDIPEGMVYREVPEYKYLVFTHHGKLDKLGETYKYIFETWIPQSIYKAHPDKYDMEVYTDEFNPGSENSKFNIYVAIQ